MPQIPTQAERNRIPSRGPSGASFKPSFLPSEAPASYQSPKKMAPPVQYPSNYADKSQLGASAARITELMKNHSQPNLNEWSYNPNPVEKQVQGRAGSSRKKSVRFQENAEENKSLHIEGENEETMSIRNQKQSELRDELFRQIEENRKRREEENMLKKKQDELEDERIRKELEEEERRFNLEKEMEDKKRQDALRENQDIIDRRRAAKMAHPANLELPQQAQEPPPPDYSNYHKANKDFSRDKFAPGQAPPEHQPPGPVNRERRYENDIFAVAAEPAQKHHRLPNWPMRNFDTIHKEDLIKELQLLLKKNLEVEAEKLKEEFQFNQQEFTDQLDKLK